MLLWKFHWAKPSSLRPVSENANKFSNIHCIFRRELIVHPYFPKNSNVLLKLSPIACAVINTQRNSYISYFMMTVWSMSWNIILPFIHSMTCVKTYSIKIIISKFLVSFKPQKLHSKSRLLTTLKKYNLVRSSKTLLAISFSYLIFMFGTAFNFHPPDGSTAFDLVVRPTRLLCARSVPRPLLAAISTLLHLINCISSSATVRRTQFIANIGLFRVDSAKNPNIIIFGAQIFICFLWLVHFDKKILL